jgi:hypothetical protein
VPAASIIRVMSTTEAECSSSSTPGLSSNSPAVSPADIWSVPQPKRRLLTGDARLPLQQWLPACHTREIYIHVLKSRTTNEDPWSGKSRHSRWSSQMSARLASESNSDQDPVSISSHSNSSLGLFIGGTTSNEMDTTYIFRDSKFSDDHRELWVQCLRCEQDWKGLLYSSEYTDIPQVFFTPHQIGHCCTNANRGHCCALGHSWICVRRGRCCATACFNNGPAAPLLRNNHPSHASCLPRRKSGTCMQACIHTHTQTHTHMEGPIRYSPLTLEGEEYLTMTSDQIVHQWPTWCGVKNAFEMSVYSKEYTFPISAQCCEHSNLRVYLSERRVYDV